MASPYTARTTYYGVLAFSTLLAWPIARRAFYPPYNGKKRAEEKTVILTGATGTMATGAAYHLAKRKCRLIMACRNMEKCKALRRELVLLTDNKNISCRRLNLEDINSINDFADDIIKNEVKIDALINGAGVRYLPEREITQYGIEKHFWINFLAPYLLTLKLFDKLKESAKQTKDSRVVNIVGKPKKWWHIDADDINFDNRKYSPNSAYAQSKLAMSLFTIKLNQLFEQTCNVRAFGVSPPNGIIKPILDHETKLQNQLHSHLYQFLSLWWTTSAHDTCGSTVKCAIDDHMLEEDGGGGGLYSYMNEFWGKNKGWGPLASRELDMDFVWNLGANILLKIGNGVSTSTISTKTGFNLDKDDIEQIGKKSKKS